MKILSLEIFTIGIYQHDTKYLKRAEDDAVLPNPSERLAVSIPSLEIAAVNNTVKAVGEIHCDGKGPYDKCSAAQIDKWAWTTHTITIDYRRTGIGNGSRAQYKCTGISEGHPYCANSHV